MSICIKTVNNITNLQKVWKLTQEVFINNDYMDYSKKLYSHYPHVDLSEDEISLYKHTTVFTAHDKDLLVGSISCTIDEECGLSLDITFSDITRGLRQKGILLGSSWRAVIKPGYRRNKQLVPILLNEVYEWIKHNNIDYLLAEIHPKHIKFYSKVVGFEQISESRENIYVKNNPSVLMKLNVEKDLCVWEKNRRRLIKNEYERMVEYS